MATEHAIVKRIRLRLNAIDGVYCIKTHGGIYSKVGTPDLIGTAWGIGFAFEVKRPRNSKTTLIQAHELNKWHDAGSMACIIKSVEQALTAMDSIKKFLRKSGLKDGITFVFSGGTEETS